jgi:predicted O-linked N-acetylglucosamine transferase (SPINDLY family)
LAEIAEGDPTGRIILLEGLYPAWRSLLETRWEKAFPNLSKSVVFLPRLSPEQFLELMSHLDVLLDPIHFGSGNSMYEAMALGIPVVTWPGAYMRGRIVAGAYRQIGLTQAPIAISRQGYAPLVLALGRSPQRRQTLREAIRNAARRELFDDMMAVRELEDFLESAVAAAAEGRTAVSPC